MNTASRLAGIAPAAALTVLALAACTTSSSTGTGNTSSAGRTPSAKVTAAQGPAAPQHLDVTGFATLSAAPGTVLLDVRTPEEFAAGHLAGARNLSFRAADFTARIAALDHGTSYAVYCRSGNRSGQALQVMTANGFTHIADLAGGIAAWSASGQAVATG